MIEIKSDNDIKEMRKGGRISHAILDYALSLCTVGRTTKEIDEMVGERMNELGVSPWFKEVDNYQYSTCISVNEEWIHGIPKGRKLKKDDVVSIDLGVKYGEFYLDNCWTCVVQGGKPSDDVRYQFKHSDPAIEKFLVDGLACFYNSIDKCVVGNRIGDISYEMGNCAESKGYSVIDDFTGHGIGRFYHEDPSIPCYGVRGAGPLIKKGMVLAIELMYTTGSYEHDVASDGWTIVTADGKISAMFEHTVAVYSDNTIILT